jgi:phi13 family phage major tail protein
MKMATVEFRGCKNLVYAEVTKDNNETGTGEGYVVGTVKTLAPVAEIAKTVETANAAHYYDNKAAIVINSEGADTVTFTIAVPSDEVLAEITGRTYDSTKKMFIDSERTNKMFAVGYILGEEGTDEDERYVWRYKGSFNVPDESAKTDDNSTDASNMSLVFTGIYTEHIFTNGKGTGVAGVAKAAFIRKSSNVATETQWFATVSTPDTTF